MSAIDCERHRGNQSSRKSEYCIRGFVGSRVRRGGGGYERLGNLARRDPTAGRCGRQVTAQRCGSAEKAPYSRQMTALRPPLQMLEGPGETGSCLRVRSCRYNILWDETLRYRAL